MLRTLLIPEIHFAESPLHWRVFAFALVTALGAGTLAGLIPALHHSSPNLTSQMSLSGELSRSVSAARRERDPSLSDVRGLPSATL